MFKLTKYKIKSFKGVYLNQRSNVWSKKTFWSFSYIQRVAKFQFCFANQTQKVFVNKHLIEISFKK